MSVKTLRLEKGWSQEHLAQISGLSLRTIQRIESGQRAGIETKNCLSAVFETDISNIIEEPVMTTAANATPPNPETASGEKKEAVEYVQNIKAFRLNAIMFIIIIPCLYIVNSALSPDYFWIKWVALAWLASFALHALAIKMLFGTFGVKWEQAEIDKRLNRNQSGRG